MKRLDKAFIPSPHGVQQLNQTFSSIGTRAMQPTENRKLEWSAAPRDQEERTSTDNQSQLLCPNASIEQRRTFTISPPTIPRSGISDAARIFSSAFRPPPHESISSHPLHSNHEQHPKPINDRGFHTIEPNFSHYPTSVIASTLPKAPITLLEAPPGQSIASGNDVYRQNFFAPVHNRDINTGNSFDSDSISAPQQYCVSISSPGLSSIAELRSLSQHSNAFLPLETPSRLRPASTTSLDTVDSAESASSSRRSVSHGGARKRNRRKSVASPGLCQHDWWGDDDEKSPAPQNLRGDPFRSAKVKTELCRHYGTEVGCPFGDKCNYAHGEHERKFTKLIDLKKAGLVDIEIFRTHPCLTWVATGACPFDQRCIGLHDPFVRCDPSNPAWLPHAETKTDSIGSGANVDSFFHERVSSVYNCCPVYGYVPRKMWKSELGEINESWEHFYSYVCNLKSEDASTGDAQDSQSRSLYDLSEANMLQIVLKMRERKAGQSYTYSPTHSFCGELCMVLQTRFFRSISIQPNGENIDRLEEVLQPNSDNVSTQSPQPYSKHIKIHEVAFGPVGDPSARSVSLWFDIPKSDIVPCTRQQAKHQKRSRHRLKSPRLKSPRIQENILSPDSSQNDRNVEHNGSIRIAFFHHYQPRDDATFQLITEILTHRLQDLMCMSGQFDILTTISIKNLLESEDQRLRAIFLSLNRFWMTWSWPFKTLKERIDNNTDVPPIDGNYDFLIDTSKNFHSETFFGIDDVNKADLIPSTLKLLPAFSWKSFIINIQLIHGRTLKDIKDHITKPIDLRFQTLRRLPILRHLSLGESMYRSRVLPILRDSKYTSCDCDGEKITPDSKMSLDTILNGWDGIAANCVRNQSTTTRLASKLSEESFSNVRSANLSNECANLLQCYAEMWTRIPL